MEEKKMEKNLIDSLEKIAKNLSLICDGLSDLSCDLDKMTILIQKIESRFDEFTIVN